MARIALGLSGFSYSEWRGEGLFYPPELKPAGFLAHYASRFDAVEMDGTWYRMPSEKAVQTWIAQTPASFQFCFKVHRQVTHFSRLRPEGWDSLAFQMKRLGPAAAAGRAGPLLVQLPPNLRRDDERLAKFLESAPRAWPETPSAPRPRYAVEFRHDSWKCEEVYAILRGHGAAWVGADTDEADALRIETADFAYYRLRKTDYGAHALGGWASHFDDLVRRGKDVFAFGKHEDAERPWEWMDLIRGGVGTRPGPSLP